jgi:hypothetical protein
LVCDGLREEREPGNTCGKKWRYRLEARGQFDRGIVLLLFFFDFSVDFIAVHLNFERL